MENNVFKNLAAKYDTPERIALANVIANKVREHLTDSSDQSLLDYGSGTGLVGLQLNDLIASTTLVDRTESMVEIANDKVSHQNLPNVQTAVADFMEDDRGLKSDIILVSLVLLHIKETKSILKSLYNVLNENGRLIIIDFNKNEKVSHPNVHNGFVHEELTQLLSEVGFKSSKFETFYQGEKIFIKEDAELFIASSYK